VRGLHLKERTPAAQLHDKIIPVVIVDDFSSDTPNDPEVPCGGGTFAATPAAGQFEMVQLFNPVGSGKIVQVDEISISADIAGTVLVWTPTIALTNLIVGSTQRKDTQDQATILTTGQIRTESQAGNFPSTANGVMHALLIPASDVRILKLEQPIILQPGTGANVGSGTANQKLTVGYQWRELGITVK